MKQRKQVMQHPVYCMKVIDRLLLYDAYSRIAFYQCWCIISKYQVEKTVMKIEEILFSCKS